MSVTQTPPTVLRGTHVQPGPGDELHALSSGSAQEPMNAIASNDVPASAGVQDAPSGTVPRATPRKPASLIAQAMIVRSQTDARFSNSVNTASARSMSSQIDRTR